MLSKEKIAEIVKKYGKNEKDTGSVEVQIALLTEQINELTKHLKANKKDALLWLLEYLGKKKSNLAAMGDGDNDIEVLKLAGKSFAPENATDLVKATVDHVVSSNDENGVSEAIEMILEHNRRLKCKKL